MEKVTFLITNKCNFRCKHCFVSGGKKIDNELTDEEKYLAINKLADFGVKKITFSGGEPLMNKEIFEYMNYAKNKGLQIGFLTNGLLLTDEKIEIIKKITDTFSISLYTQDILGISENEYKNYLNKTINSIKKIHQLKFTITMLISKNNKNKVYELMRLLIKEDINPQTIRIYMITPLGRAKNNLELCTEDFNCEDILYDMPKDIKDINLNISFEYASVKKDELTNSKCSPFCPIINYEKNYINKFADPHMDANGDLYLCGLILRNKRYCIGNIINNTKNEIIENIERVVKDIKSIDKSDCCPALNRKVKKDEQLVCPVIYIKNRKG